MSQADNLAALGTNVNSSGVLQPAGGGTGTTTSTGTGSAVLSNNPTLAGLTDSGNLTFTGTGNRITGDFSNGTLANRVAFQTSTTNSNSIIPVIPNGTATTSAIQLFNNSDANNASQADLRVVGSTDVRLASAVAGTGTHLPLTMYTNGSERLRIDTSGNVLVGGTTQRLNAKITNNGAYWSGSGNSSGDAEYILSNYASATPAWTMSVRQDVGGANNDLKFLRLNSSGAFQDIAMQITQANGNLLFNSGYGSAAVAYGCRAWVNFNGTGTPSIRASGNVSSIGDNGAGDYTINFTTAMPDANYSISGTGGGVNAGAGTRFWVNVSNLTDTTAAPTTTTCRFTTGYSDGTFADCGRISIQIMR